MKIVFFGTPSFVNPVLEELEKNFDVTAVRNPDDVDIKKLADLKPDLFVVAAFGKILSKEILDIPKFGAINIHPSLLPKYRGPTPVQSAILSGETKTGVSIIKMDEEVDHGPILAQIEEPILTTDTSETLLIRLFKIGSQLLAKTIPLYLSSELKSTEQDHNSATFTKTLTRDSGFIDIENPPSNLANMIRAYFPWPGVWFKWNEKIVKLLPESKIQVEGKNQMSYKDFINGYPGSGKEILKKLNLESHTLS